MVTPLMRTWTRMNLLPGERRWQRRTFLDLGSERGKQDSALEWKTTLPLTLGVENRTTYVVRIIPG